MKAPHNLGPLSTSWSDSALTKAPQSAGVHHDIVQEEVILRNTFMNAKMGPIAHYLGGAFANQTKSFLIRWPDEHANQHQRAPIA